MLSFFNQYRYKRLKLAELLMFLQSVFKNNSPLLLAAVGMVQELGLNSTKGLIVNIQKRIKTMMDYITGLITSKRVIINSNKGFIYSSEFLMKTYARKHSVSFTADPILFIVNCLVSFTKGFKPQQITVDILNDESKPKGNILSRFIPYTFEPFLRVRHKIELVPTVSVFDDVASFPLLTAERSSQWVKDLFAETRRWQNTFVIAAQRHNLLNKTLRSLTHTFFIGYSLVDDDIPRIAKEIPSNLLSGSEFKLLYQTVIKPFTFFVYNNKLGYNVLTLK